MGICPIFSSSNQPQPQNNPINTDANLVSSQRRGINAFQPNQQPNNNRKTQRPDQNAVGIQKKTNLNQSVNSSGERQGESKNGSTVFTSSLSEKKGSSLLFSGGIFQNSTIILKNGKQNSPGLENDERNCYVLIDNFFLIKKTKDNIRVVSPHNEAKYNCQINLIKKVFYLEQGVPIDSIKQISPCRIIQTSQSPIKTKLTLLCKNCQKIKQTPCQVEPSSSISQTPRLVKFTFSTSLIHPRQIICDECQVQGQWRLVKFQSNFPVWGNRNKIQEEVLEELPEVMRVMGCISCLKYVDGNEVLPCGCFICEECFQNNGRSRECKLCESI